MSAIGFVKLDPDTGVYTGALQTLTLNVAIEIRPNATKAGDQPDYRIYNGSMEVGAGWNKVGKESGREYVSTVFEAPELPNGKLYANLGRAAGSSDSLQFALLWNPSK